MVEQARLELATPSLFGKFSPIEYTVPKFGALCKIRTYKIRNLNPTCIPIPSIGHINLAEETGFLAEETGFEPASRYQPTVFKTA